MTKLDESLSKARATYIRRIKARQDVGNVNGSRWEAMNVKLLKAEEQYHMIGNKVRMKKSK